jgi:hypothetical protein
MMAEDKSVSGSQTVSTSWGEEPEGMVPLASFDYRVQVEGDGSSISGRLHLYADDDERGTVRYDLLARDAAAVREIARLVSASRAPGLIRRTGPISEAT